MGYIGDGHRRSAAATPAQLATMEQLGVEIAEQRLPPAGSRVSFQKVISESQALSAVRGRSVLIRKSIHMSAYMSIHSSAQISIHMSAHMPMRMPAHVSIRMLIHMPIHSPAQLQGHQGRRPQPWSPTMRKAYIAGTWNARPLSEVMQTR